MTVKNVFFFIGMTIMMLFASLSKILLDTIRDSFVIISQGSEAILAYKLWAIPTFLVLAGLFIALLRKTSFSCFFKFYALLHSLVLGLILALLYFEIPFISNFYVMGSLYNWLNLASLFLPVLVWGYANQEYTFKSASLVYVGFFTILSTLFPLSALFSMELIQYSAGNFMVLLVPSLILSLAILGIYLVMPSLEVAAEPEKKTGSWSLGIALALLIFGIAFAKFYPEMVFKSASRDFKETLFSMSPLEFESTGLAFMWGLAFTVQVAMGVLLYKLGRKFYTLFTGITVVILAVFGTAVLVQPFNTTTAPSIFVSKIGLVTFGTTLFLYLKELLYLCIPLRNRFTVKIIIDLFVVSVGASLARAVTQTALIATEGSLASLAPVFTILFGVGIAISLFSLIPIHRQLQKV